MLNVHTVCSLLEMSRDLSFDITCIGHMTYSCRSVRRSLKNELVLSGSVSMKPWNKTQTHSSACLTQPNLPDMNFPPTYNVSFVTFAYK